MKIKRICEKCGISFEVISSVLNHNKGKYCSRRCQWDSLKSRKRKPISEETRQKMIKSHIGHKNNIGFKHSEETKIKMSNARIGKSPFNKGIVGENSHSWKGGKKLSRKRAKEKLKNNIKYRLNSRMSISIYSYLKRGIKNNKKWRDLVGYNVEQLKKHLKLTMPDNCSWQDFLDGKLEIDHIIPVSLFNFNKPEHIDFKRCWALSNLRLLSKHENHIKSDKLIKSFQLGIAV